MRVLFSLCLGVALVGTAPVGAQSSPAEPNFAAALADPQRPAADRERDAARFPADLLAFAQIEKGEKVGDYIMGGGYWTRILSSAVGPEGHVYAFQPDEFIAFRPAYGEEQDAAVAGRANVTPLRGPVAAPPFAEPLDTIITVQNLHDLYIGAMIPSVLAVLMYGLAVVIYSRLHPEAAPPGRRRNWRERLLETRNAWGVVVLVAVVMGGIYAGWFTALEAAAVGAVASFVFLVARGRFTWPGFVQMLADTATTTVMK